MKIHFIRHGRTEGNIKRFFYGATDIPLLDSSFDELEELAAKGIYPQPEDGAYYTTGMIRTEQTFEIIYGDRPHGVIEELREMDFGDFEMRSNDELSGTPEYDHWCTAEGQEEGAPGGESPSAFAARLKEGFSKLVKDMERRQAEEGVIIAHGGSIAFLMFDAFGGEEVNLYRWTPDPGRGYTFIVEDGKLVDYAEI